MPFCKADYLVGGAAGDSAARAGQEKARLG